jgi:hypothetical protein
VLPLTPGDRRWCHRRTTPILGADRYDVQAVQRADGSLDAVVLRGRPPVPVQSAHFADADAYERWFDRLIAALQDVDPGVRWASLYDRGEGDDDEHA